MSFDSLSLYHCTCKARRVDNVHPLPYSSQDDTDTRARPSVRPGQVWSGRGLHLRDMNHITSSVPDLGYAKFLKTLLASLVPIAPFQCDHWCASHVRPSLVVQILLIRPDVKDPLSDRKLRWAFLHHFSSAVGRYWCSCGRPGSWIRWRCSAGEVQVVVRCWMDRAGMLVVEVLDNGWEGIDCPGRAAHTQAVARVFRSENCEMTILCVFVWLCVWVRDACGHRLQAVARFLR